MGIQYVLRDRALTVFAYAAVSYCACCFEIFSIICRRSNLICIEKYVPKIYIAIFRYFKFVSLLRISTATGRSKCMKLHHNGDGETIVPTQGFSVFYSIVFFFFFVEIHQVDCEIQ